MAKNPQGWFSKSEPSQKKGEGPYSDSSDLKLTRIGTPRLSMGRDIMNKVERNADRNGGFFGKLDKGE